MNGSGQTRLVGDLRGSRVLRYGKRRPSLARLRETVGAPLPPVDRADYDRNVDAVRIALGEEMFSAASAKGRAMPLEQAIEFALSEA